MNQEDMELLSLELLRYGKYLTDDQICVPQNQGQSCCYNIRIRCIEYNGFIYYHKMLDGETVDIKKIGRTKRSLYNYGND